MGKVAEQFGSRNESMSGRFAELLLRDAPTQEFCHDVKA